jgi:type I restriction enzyme S subunit
MKQGWEIKMLKEIGVAQTGTTPKTADKDNYGDFIPFIKPADIDIYDDGEIRYDNDGLSKKGLQTGRKMPEGSILMVCIGATIGKVGFVDRDVSCNQQINSLTVRKEFHPKFVYYALSTPSFYEQVIKNSAQATLPIINKGKWECLSIPFPKSLTEQQRIVAILDEAFASINKAKTNAEKNLKNAKELFESYLQGVFENKGEGWEEKTLGEVCNVIGGGTPSKANSKFYDGDIYWATVRDMKGEVIKDTEHKITKDAVKNSSTNIIPKGNVIIATRVGLGRVCLIQHDTAINQDLRGVVPINSNKLSVDFLYRWFKSIAHKIVEEGTGATVQGVKLPFIKSLVIYVPPINEQNKIIAKLDALSAETRKLEAIYTQKINDLEELKKSVLKKAFSGELRSPEGAASTNDGHRPSKKALQGRNI